MSFGPHAAFVVAAYAAALAVIIGLIAWVYADYVAQRRLLVDLEARGASRRSEKAEAA
jgi:heme exporter protein D